MKNILTSIMLIFYMTSSANSIENKCNGIKKLSKEYIKCKTNSKTFILIRTIHQNWKINAKNLKISQKSEKKTFSLKSFPKVC